MEMNQDMAQTLFFEGATCICFDFPVKSEFGIDVKSFTTGEKFCGLKMIPPGVHFIYYSIENNYGNQSPRIGFFHYFKKKEIIVKKWDSEKEVFVDEDDRQKIERLRENLKSMDKYLGPYPYDTWEKWKNLSNYISQKVLEKTVPLSGQILSVLELKGPVQQNKTPKTEPSRRLNTKLFVCDEKRDDFFINLEAAEGTEIRFSKIPEKCYPDDSTPSEITKHSLDSSYLFKQILSQHADGNDLLGEIQLAFACFLLGHSFEAFEHWKKLIGVLCSCDEAITEYPDIFSKFITVLTHQLQEIQEDFLVDIVEGNNFVYKNLRIFFRNLYSSSTNGRLKTKGYRFQEFLTKSLSWDFNDVLKEEEEDLPVIVEF